MHLPRSQLVRDAVLAAVVTVVTQLEVLAAGDRAAGPQFAQHVAFAAMTAPLVARRVAPVAATLVAALGMVAQTAAGQAPVVGGFLAMLILLFSLGYHSTWWRGAAGVVALGAAVTSYDVLAEQLVLADLVGNVAIVVMAWASGRLVRVSTDRRVAAELTRDRAAREAVAAERSRIARDLHDSVAHALTLMTLHAGGARERAGEPDVADHLRLIEESGRGALQDMHRFLRLLGTDDQAPGTPGLQDLPDLADRVRAGGLGVALTCEIDPGDVPPSVSATAYRVVQEALTNAVKHSGGTTATVVVRAAAGALEVDVRNDGGGRPALASGSGRGISGLRERLGLFGGSLTAGPDEAAGWRVLARIPVAGGSA